MRRVAAPGLSALVAASVALGLSGCASLAGAAVSTEADYPSYADVNELRDSADLIVEVLIGESADDVMQPQGEEGGDVGHFVRQGDEYVSVGNAEFTLGFAG